MISEEKILRARERERKREEKERINQEKKLLRETRKKELKVKVPKAQPTEKDLVHRYVKRVIMNQVYHGRVDKKFEGLEHNRTVVKNLWMDTDFFFSVVFQSNEQKYRFLTELKKKFQIDVEEGYQVQIVNGIKFAESLGIELPCETVKKYPYSSLDLMPYVLDNEII